MKLRYLLLSLLPLVCAGCTLTEPLPRELPEQVDAWVANQQYGQALRMLDKVRTDHPRYIELIRMKPDVEAEAKAFARDISREAEAAWQAGDWRRAHDRLAYGLEQFPQSERLQASRAEFEAAREDYLSDLQRQLDLNTAPYLAKNLPLHRQMAQAAPDKERIVQRTQRRETQAQAMHARLVNCGMQARDQQQWPLARRCLTLAHQLVPTEGVARSLREIEAHFDERRQREADSLDADTRQWLDTARGALQQDNVKAALTAYRRIAPQHRQRDEVMQFKRTLDKRIEENIEEGIDTGRKFYTQGKVERALAIWHALKALDADHKALNAHIARAEKVLDKINRLREDKGVLPPKRSDNAN